MMGLLEDKPRKNHPLINISKRIPISVVPLVFLFFIQEYPKSCSQKNAFALCTHNFNNNNVYNERFFYETKHTLIYVLIPNKR